MAGLRALNLISMIYISLIDCLSWGLCAAVRERERERLGALVWILYVVGTRIGLVVKSNFTRSVVAIYLKRKTTKQTKDQKKNEVALTLRFRFYLLQLFLVQCQ